MTKDIYTGDEWELTDKDETKPKNNQKQPKSKSSVKEYIIVALIAILTVAGINNYIYARNSTGTAAIGCGSGAGANGCGSGAGAGGCCGGGSGAALSDDEIIQLGLDYYVTTYGDSEVEAQLQDFGCHQEVYIYKAGQLVAKLAYRNGQLTEI